MSIVRETLISSPSLDVVVASVHRLTEDMQDAMAEAVSEAIDVALDAMEDSLNDWLLAAGLPLVKVHHNIA